MFLFQHLSVALQRGNVAVGFLATFDKSKEGSSLHNWNILLTTF